MKITKNILFFGILIFGLIVNSLVLLDFQYLYLKAILSFAFLTIIPGLLITLMLRIRNISFWEYLVYTIGLSIAFLMFGGLAINWILPWLHITDKPLSLTPLLISFNALLLIFWHIAYIRNNGFSLKIEFPKLNWLNKIFFITPMIFPLLSILGAITLNNDGPNYLTMTMLGGIAIYVPLVVLFRNKLNENIYPWSIFLIGAAVLLMLSLRSWYISGYDISLEYRVFRITKEYSLWSMDNLRSAYNACLSLTILPTIFDAFLKVNDQYIFKLAYPLLFSLTPIAMYLFFKRMTSNIASFFASIFFISNPWFIDPIVTLARQEIAFLFFALSLLILFNNQIETRIKYFLVIILSFSMVVSHYSTSYVTIILFTLVYLGTLTVRILNKCKIQFTVRLLNFFNLYFPNNKQVNIKGIYIILLILFTFLWYSQITQSSGNVTYFLRNTIKNLNQILVDEKKNAIVNQVFNVDYNPISQTTYDEYYALKTKEYGARKEIKRYDEKSYENYKFLPRYSRSLDVPNSQVYGAFFKLYKILLLLVPVFIGAGFFFIVFSKSSGFIMPNPEYLLLALVSGLLIVAMVVLPFVSQGYNFDRLYMQMMIVIAPVEIMGGILIFNKLLRLGIGNTVMVISIFLVSIFLFTFGFVWQIVGGETVMWLNNFGSSYDLTYTHKSEVISTNWLTNFFTDTVYASPPSHHVLISQGKIRNIVTDSLPPTFSRDSYVFLGYTNYVNQIGYFTIRGMNLGFVYPLDFLDQNKNKIYDNKGSAIYR